MRWRHWSGWLWLARRKLSRRRLCRLMASQATAGRRRRSSTGLATHLLVRGLHTEQPQMMSNLKKLHGDHGNLRNLVCVLHGYVTEGAAPNMSRRTVLTTL